MLPAGWAGSGTRGSGEADRLTVPPCGAALWWGTVVRHCGAAKFGCRWCPWVAPSAAQADTGDAGRAEGRATGVDARRAVHAARPDRRLPVEHHPCPTLPTT